MGEFEIECKKAAGLAAGIHSLSRDMRRQEGRVEDVLRQLRSQDTCYRQLEQALSGIAAHLHRQQEQMKQYGDTLEEIVKAYEHTETELLEAGTSLHSV